MCQVLATSDENIKFLVKIYNFSSCFMPLPSVTLLCLKLEERGEGGGGGETQNGW